MDQKNKTVVITVVAILAVALVALNFDKITGKAVSTVDLNVSPPAVSSGQSIIVTVNTHGNRVKNPLELRKVGGTEVRDCDFDKESCTGNWCSKSRLTGRGTILTATCRTSPGWVGGFSVAAKEYQTSRVLGTAYFTVT